jgi:histidyl-tRNA synthetase
VAVVSAEPDFARRLNVAGALRGAGLAVRPDGSARKLGRQLESASKAGARYAVIVDQLAGGGVILRDLRGGEQSETALDEVAAVIRGQR